MLAASTTRPRVTTTALDSELSDAGSAIDPVTPKAAVTPSAPTPAPAPRAAPPSSVAAQPVAAPGDPGGGVTGMVTLDDGNGGVVPIPPTPLAPPSVVPPATAAAAPQPFLPPWATPDAGAPAPSGAATPTPIAPVGATDTAPWMAPAAVAPTPTPADPTLPPQGGDASPIVPPADGGLPPWAQAPDANPLTPPTPAPTLPVSSPITPALGTSGAASAVTGTAPWDQAGGQGMAEASGAAAATPIPMAPEVTSPAPWESSLPGVTMPGAGSPGTGEVPPMLGPEDAGAQATGLPATPAASADDRAALSGGGGTGAALPSFSADDNLIAKTILPSTSPRLAQLQGMTDQQLQKILNGPDRLAIAKQMWDSFNEQTAPAYSHAITDATNAAAAHGRLGSGQLTNEYGDLAASREHDLNSMKTKYLADALEGTIGDNRANLSAVQGVEGSTFGEGASDRNEARTERSYQEQLAQRAVAQRILEAQMESGDTQQAFENAMAMYKLGNANNPEAAYETAASQATSEAGGQNQSIQDLMKLIASMQSKGT